MVTEQRKQYIKNWKKNNKDRIRSTFRKWYLSNRNKPYYLGRSRNHLKTGEKYLGTSGIGREYELLALSLLKGSIDCNSITFRGGWDIEWNGLKIDVKMRNKNLKGFYLFSKKKTCKADYFLCFCVDNNVIKYILFIPNKEYKPIFSIKDSEISTKYFKYIIKEQ